MKDFLKAAVVLGVMLALALIARVAAFAYPHGETAAVADPAAIMATDKGCGDKAVKLTCLQHTDSRS